MKLLHRWLVSGGKTGEVPRWYRIVKAAQYLGCPPWELEQMPWRYVLQAEEAQAAEAVVKDQSKPPM